MNPINVSERIQEDTGAIRSLPRSGSYNSIASPPSWRGAAFALQKRFISLVLAIACALFACGTRSAEAVTLSFSNVVGAPIAFDGTDGSGTVGSFQFTTSAFPGYVGLGFQVTLSDSGATPSAVGLNGTISGVYRISNIGPSGSGGEVATVSGSGILTIVDAQAHNLTAICTFSRIFSGGIVGIDSNGATNLTSINYSGSNPDLQVLAAAGSGQIVISTQNAGPISLTQLTTNGFTFTSSYSGTLAAIPKTPSGPLTTFTMGGWGSKPAGNNPGTLLQLYFPEVYPNGLTVGRLPSFYLHFTGQAAIQAFLPCGGTPAPLTKNCTDPTKKLGNLAGQVVALQLAVDFSNAGVLPSGLGAAVFKTGPFAGMNVSSVLSLANYVLGGGSLPPMISYSDINDAITLVNENYDDGSNGGALIP